MPFKINVFLILLTFSVTVSCKTEREEKIDNLTLNDIAEKYVKLSLEIGNYDNDYIDAYYGPEEWRLNKLQDPGNQSFPYDELKWKASRLIHLLEDIDESESDSLEKLRSMFLIKQLTAAKAKVAMLSGYKFCFDKESELLYDAVPPRYDKKNFDELLAKLDTLLPGKEGLSERYQKFSEQFIIPEDKIDTVFKTAIAEARKRTLKYFQLPENENFKLEYVKNKSWSGYNWYKGNSFSLIQINTDLPIFINRAIDLASHEGYPGHHVYNLLLEQNLVKKKGWMEFTVYPLFSPQSLIAEGSANFGIEVAFPGKERLKFEKEVLFPLAGLDTGKAELYYKIQKILDKLSYAEIETAREYINDDIDRKEAVEWLMKYTLKSKERADQRIKFFDQFRSYVINYYLGEDLVETFIEKHGGTASNPERRWEVFSEILPAPGTVSSLH